MQIALAGAKSTITRRVPGQVVIHDQARATLRLGQVLDKAARFGGHTFSFKKFNIADNPKPSVCRLNCVKNEIPPINWRYSTHDSIRVQTAYPPYVIRLYYLLLDMSIFLLQSFGINSRL